MQTPLKVEHIPPPHKKTGERICVYLTYTSHTRKSSHVLLNRYELFRNIATVLFYQLVSIIKISENCYPKVTLKQRITYLEIIKPGLHIAVSGLSWSLPNLKFCQKL